MYLALTGVSTIALINVYKCVGESVSQSYTVRTHLCRPTVLPHLLNLLAMQMWQGHSSFSLLLLTFTNRLQKEEATSHR